MKHTSLRPGDIEKVFTAANHPLRLDDILRLTDLSRKLKKAVLQALHDLADKGVLIRMRGGTWAMASTLGTLRGTLAVQRSGAAFVAPVRQIGGQGGKRHGATGRTDDLYIAPGNLQGAWNGDLVEAVILPKRTGGRPEGRVVRIVERRTSDLTVIVLPGGSEAGRKGAGTADGLLARPVDPRFNLLVRLDADEAVGNLERQALLRVRLKQELASPYDCPLWSAALLYAIGREDDLKVQETFSKLNHEIPMQFPEAVLEEAAGIAASGGLARGSVPDGGSSRDVRDLALVTIDGEEAKDFDDAVYVEKLGNSWRLVVAIADVSFYVRPGGRLDREAAARGNSYYFPSSVEPMLPEALSNGLCSLAPDEDRRVMVADMVLNSAGVPQSSEFYPAVMRSRAKLTYTQVQNFLDGDSESLPAMAQKMLRDAARLAELLIRRRDKQGGLDFAIPEAEFIVENGTVKGLRNRKRLFSHRLIEFFMIEANEAVARLLTARGQPFLYRIHPAPGLEKLETLAAALKGLPLQLPLPREIKSADWIKPVLDAAAAGQQPWLVDTLILRAMMQARYSPAQEAHFGLASECYCHFTSPIRRYADLVNHRALRLTLGLGGRNDVPPPGKLHAVADICNNRERIAQDAEREITRRFACLLLRGQEGREFPGIISGVMPFGVFVKLGDMPVEGMIRVESLGNDYFVFDDRRHELRGEKSGEILSLGGKIRVRLLDVNIGRLEINLLPADKRSRRPRKDPGPGKEKFKRKGA